MLFVLLSPCSFYSFEQTSCTANHNTPRVNEKCKYKYKDKDNRNKQKTNQAFEALKLFWRRTEGFDLRWRNACKMFPPTTSSLAFKHREHRAIFFHGAGGRTFQSTRQAEARASRAYVAYQYCVSPSSLSLQQTVPTVR